MNLVVLVGNLTRDPEVRYTQSGLAVANINVAVNRFNTKDGGPDADFFRVTVFGKQAELAERYLSKGRKVGVEGRIQNDNYEKEGQTIYRDTIIANRIEFLSPKGSGEQFGGDFGGQADDAFGRSSGQSAYAPAAPQQSAAPGPSAAPEPSAAPQQSAAPGQASVPQGFSALEDEEDDLPF
ncbi:MAG: single-stranded DNA-binding protein [Clostridiales Family XIII bacterium]|jgi:single-strand DNA-binding protein|nr:single-stranded DNA-binding protein [Clostridiales Family XIII bacterium]